MTQPDLFDRQHFLWYKPVYEEIEVLARIQSGQSIIPRQPDGQALKDAGMAATLELEPAEWLELALDRLAAYAAERAVPTFLAEDFRRFWADSGRPEPHSHKVWGALFNHVAKQGLIRATGRYAKAKSAKTHGHPVMVWERA